jgi:lipopolysaccharide O-acetyltransferase
MSVKSVIKTLYTYVFNWHNIIRFHHFGKESFLGRRFTLNLSGNGIYIGDRVRIGNDSRLSCYSAPKHVASIRIEDGAYMASHVSILTADSVVIEKDVLIASYVSIMGYNHSMDPESPIRYGNQELTTSPILIKKGCWIGQNVTIISGKEKGITIGEKSIIGAGSVVNYDIPDYSMAVGNPARIIKRYNFATHQWERI